MTRRLPINDRLPWHRQFWPWFLILLPASVVVASLFTVYIANRDADDLVADDYYKEGLAINQQLKKQRRAQALGQSASLRFSADEVWLTLAKPVAADELRLSLAHPLEADRDFSAVLARVSQTSYHGTLAQRVAPHWHWTLEQQHDSDWRLAGTLQAGDMGDEPGG